jgi:uncharacterized LabA/DUF88 family protein
MSDKAGFIPQKNKNDLTSHFAKLVSGKKVSVAIDAANLYYASNVSKIKIDYIQVASWFQANCKSVNLNFYTAFDPEDDKQMEFFESLETCGYKVTKKPIKVFEDSKKGNMDIELAVDAIVQKDTYEILILLSGDGDFTYLISALEKLGKETIILGIGGFTSYELHQEAGRYFFLNRISHVWRKYNNKTEPESISKQEEINKEEGVLILSKNEGKSSNYLNQGSIPAKLEKTKKTGSEETDKAQNEVREIISKPKATSSKKSLEIKQEKNTSAKKQVKKDALKTEKSLAKIPTNSTKTVLETKTTVATTKPKVRVKLPNKQIKKEVFDKSEYLPKIILE